MKFQLTHPLPSRCMVAVSGGVDSMVALHWLSRVGGRVAGVLHVNHNTGAFADKAEVLVKEYVEHLFGSPPDDREVGNQEGIKAQDTGNEALSKDSRGLREGVRQQGNGGESRLASGCSNYRVPASFKGTAGPEIPGTFNRKPGCEDTANYAERTRGGSQCGRGVVTNYNDPVSVLVCALNGAPPRGESKEAWWRDARYAFFKEVAADFNLPIVLGHQLNDCIEEYVLCTMVRGYQGVIPYANGPCIRPFRLWSRELIEEYAHKHNVPYLTDPSNDDIRFKRNYVRSELVPGLLQLNPGLPGLVSDFVKKYVPQYRTCKENNPCV